MCAAMLFGIGIGASAGSAAAGLSTRMGWFLSQPLYPCGQGCRLKYQLTTGQLNGWNLTTPSHADYPLGWDGQPESDLLRGQQGWNGSGHTHKTLRYGHLLRTCGDVRTTAENCLLGGRLSRIAELILMLGGQIFDGDLVALAAQFLVPDTPIFDPPLKRVGADAKQLRPL